MTNEELEYLQIGNVIRITGIGIVIISGKREITSNKKTIKLIDWISLVHGGSSGSIPYTSQYTEEDCGCVLVSPDGWPDPECEDCQGEGYIIEKNLSMDDATFIAENVKDYVKETINMNDLFK